MSYKAGSVIGDYVVLGAVGAGGMGAVYKVQHVITQRVEAMKLLASGRTDPDQEQRFLREMQLQARLHHPNIAAVYNAFRYYDEFFLVMEFIEGESLDTILSRGRLPLPTGLHFARQVLFALGYAHAHGVVHRDIAPSNIIITPDGTVKLTDFGLAKTATDVRLTHSGAPLGSPWYMSPEQVRGNSTLDARSDIYSLGAVLYEIFTGSRPFDLASTFDVMRAQVEMAPMPPGERTPGLPRGLNEIILTALAKDPSARFQSAEQFYAALEPLQAADASAPPRAASIRPVRPSVAAAAPRKPMVSVLPRLARLPVLQAALGSAACLVTMFVGYSAYSFLRATSTTELPAIVPAKAIIPPAPVVPVAQEAPPVVEASAPTLDPPSPPTPRPHRPRPLVARTTAPAPVALTQPVSRELPAPPERIITPALETPSPRPEAAILGSRSSLAALTAATPNPSPEAPVITNTPDPVAESVTKPKKEGNRFFKALHRVNPFHKSAAEPSGDNQ